MDSPIEITMVWVTDADNEDESWLLTAWDEWSMEGNERGWDEEIEKARSTYKHVRLITTYIDWSDVTNAFLPVAVSNSGAKVVDTDA